MRSAWRSGAMSATMAAARQRGMACSSAPAPSSSGWSNTSTARSSGRSLSNASACGRDVSFTSSAMSAEWSWASSGTAVRGARCCLAAKSVLVMVFPPRTPPPLRYGGSRRRPSPPQSGRAGKPRWKEPVALEPAPPLEPGEGREGGKDHQGDAPLVAVLPAVLDHVVEVHAVPANHQRREDADDGEHRQHLEDVVLFDADEADDGVEQELDLVRQVLLELVQRVDVEADGLEPIAGVLADPGLAGFLRKGGDAAEAQEAVADHGHALADPADMPERHAQPPAGADVHAVGSTAPWRLLKHLPRDLVQVLARALQEIGQTVDAGFEQRGERLDAGAGFARRAGAGGRRLERLQLGEAHCDEELGRQDHADVRQRGLRRVGPGRHRAGDPQRLVIDDELTGAF